MYSRLDEILAKVRKNVKAGFNRIGMMGFDELNVVNTRKTTKSLYDRLLAENEAAYLKAAKAAYRDGRKYAGTAGYRGDEETAIDGDWLLTVLVGYNLVTGYIYKAEAERKRLRLNEQILTAREYDSRQAMNDSLRRAANLWWTQTAQYGIDVVDAATLQAYTDAGVKKVRWVAEIDDKTCGICQGRDGKIYDIKKAPKKTHYSCRCYLEPVKTEE